MTGSVFHASALAEVILGNPVTVGVSVCKMMAVGLEVGNEPVIGTWYLGIFISGAIVEVGKDCVGETGVISAAQAVNKIHNSKFKKRFI